MCLTLLGKVIYQQICYIDFRLSLFWGSHLFKIVADLDLPAFGIKFICSLAPLAVCLPFSIGVGI